jgi:Ca2+-binding EF-hand superfamily protein
VPLSRRGSEALPEKGGQQVDLLAEVHKRMQNEMSKPLATRRFQGGSSAASVAHEREASMLLAAFLRHDGDRSGSLDQPELRLCLGELGLRGQTRVERSQIRQILWNIDSLQISFNDFVNGVVPEARQILQGLRRKKYIQFFNEVNVHNDEEVSIDDVVIAFRRRGTIVSDDVRDEAIRLFSQEYDRELHYNSRGVDMLDREAFVKFVAFFQERTERVHVLQFQTIAKKFEMDAKEQEKWRYDLVGFYNMFHDYDPCSGKFGSASGKLNEQQVVTVVRESGYMPKTSTGQARTAYMIQEFLKHEGTIGFLDFLRIMERLREPDRDRLRRSFEQFCQPGLGILMLSNIHEALADAGISPKNSHEKAEVEVLIEDVDEDGSNAIRCEDFVVMCQRIAARLRVMQRERERQYVLSAGWNEQTFIELRDAFQVFDEDMSEVLEKDELMKAVELLKGQYWQSSTNINLMFMAIGIDPSKEIKVNFLTFLKMLKILDESENRRQQGAAVGFSRDRTDELYSAFQAIQPESSDALPTVSRHVLEQVLTDVSPNMPKVQQGQQNELEVIRVLSQEPMQVEFNAFLRVMKVMEGIVGDTLAFEGCIRDILTWRDNAVHESEEQDGDPQPLPTQSGSFDRQTSGTSYVSTGSANTGMGITIQLRMDNGLRQSLSSNFNQSASSVSCGVLG